VAALVGLVVSVVSALAVPVGLAALAVPVGVVA
jgi:hypothetical protein